MDKLIEKKLEVLYQILLVINYQREIKETELRKLELLLEYYSNRNENEYKGAVKRLVLMKEFNGKMYEVS